MQIYDVLASAQGGQAIPNLARAANVPPEQMDAAIRAILPAFASAFERNTLSRGGLADFIKAIGEGHHEYLLDNPTAMADPRVRDDGIGILDHVFGSKDRSRGVAMRAAQASGLSEGLIKMLLPYIAQMVMGAIAKWAKGGLGDVVRRLPQGGAPGSGRTTPRPGGRTGGGGFELPQSERPQGGYPLPPISDTVPAGGEKEPGGGGFGIPWPQQRPTNLPRRDDGAGGRGFPFPFPFPFPQQGGEGAPSENESGSGLPWPGSSRQERERRGPDGNGKGFELPRSEMPQGGYPMPPIPGGEQEHVPPFPNPSGGSAGQSPLPIPGSGGGNNPYGDLSDILRRGGSIPGALGAGSVVRDILGGLLGFAGRGVVGWIIRFLVMRLGWGLLQRILGRVLTGR